MGMDTSANGAQLLERGRTVSDYGDPNLTPGEGGVVVLSRDGVIMGGIGVGGYIERDEELATIGLKAMRKKIRLNHYLLLKISKMKLKKLKFLTNL